MFCSAQIFVPLSFPQFTSIKWKRKVSSAGVSIGGGGGVRVSNSWLKCHPGAVISRFPRGQTQSGIESGRGIPPSPGDLHVYVCQAWIRVNRAGHDWGRQSGGTMQWRIQGALAASPPCAQDFFFLSCSFYAILSKFWAQASPGVKTPLGPPP